MKFFVKSEMNSSIVNKTLAQYRHDYSVIVYSYGDLITYSTRAFGAVTSLLNVIVFMNRTILNSSETFYYLFAMSVADFFYMSLLLLADLMNKICSTSSSQCGHFAQYFAFFLFISVNNCASSSLALFNIIMENFLTIQRLYLLQNKRFPDFLTVPRVVSVVLVFSLLFYLPTAFTPEIVIRTIQLRDSNWTEYNLVNTEFGNSVTGKLTPVVLSFIRIALSGPILLAISVYNIHVFRNYLQKKKKTTSSNSSSKANDNLTIMLTLVALMYALGNIPYMVYYSIRQVAPTFQNEFMSAMSWLSRLFLSMLVVLKVPVFYAFNKLYQRQVAHYLCGVASSSVGSVLATSASQSARSGGITSRRQTNHRA
jgi:hypothetical protein